MSIQGVNMAKAARDLLDLQEDIHALAERATHIDGPVAGILYVLSATLCAGDIKYIDELAALNREFAERARAELTPKEGK